MGNIMLWTGKIFYNYIEIVCVTCPNILKMGIRMCAMNGNLVRILPFVTVKAGDVSKFTI